MRMGVSRKAWFREGNNGTSQRAGRTGERSCWDGLKTNQDSMPVQSSYLSTKHPSFMATWMSLLYPFLQARQKLNCSVEQSNQVWARKEKSADNRTWDAKSLSESLDGCCGVALVIYKACKSEIQWKSHNERWDIWHSFSPILYFSINHTRTLTLQLLQSPACFLFSVAKGLDVYKQKLLHLLQVPGYILGAGGCDGG